MSRVDGSAAAGVYPDHVRAAERHLLGGMLQAPVEIASVVATGLVEGDFFLDAHRLVFGAIIAVVTRGERANPEVVADQLARTGRLEDAGGHSSLTTLVAEVPYTGGAVSWAQIVRRAAADRARASVACEFAERVTMGAATEADWTRLERAWRADAIGRERRFKPLTVTELLELPAPRFLLDRFIASDGITMLFGASGSYKTTVAIDWACRIASGMPGGDASTDGRPVMYVCSEGQAGWAHRVADWKSLRGVSELPNLVCVRQPPNLLSDADVAELISEANRLGELALIVFDTYSGCMIGGDENSASDANRLIANIARIVRQTGASVLLIHHSGYEQTGRARGSSALPARVDQNLHLQKHPTKKHSATLSFPKNRDHEQFAPIEIQLVAHGESLVVDHDAEARRVASFDQSVLAAVEAHPDISYNQLEPIVHGSRGAIRDALHRLLASGRVESKHGPRNAKLWRVPPAGSAGSGEVEPGALVRLPHPSPTTPVGGRGGGEVASTPPTPTGQDENDPGGGQGKITGDGDRRAA